MALLKSADSLGSIPWLRDFQNHYLAWCLLQGPAFPEVPSIAIEGLVEWSEDLSGSPHPLLRWPDRRLERLENAVERGTTTEG